MVQHTENNPVIYQYYVCERGEKKTTVLSIDIEKATGIEKAIGKTQHLIIKNKKKKLEKQENSPKAFMKNHSYHHIEW